MPIVQPSSKVLVSGANGFIAIWVVRSLLEKGYAVRGTVRSAEKGEHLKKLFAQYGDKHEVVVVEDITEEGAFDEAVKGVDAIEHTASPIHLNAKDPDELIIPAVKGTLSMLESALKHGSSVQRIVVTSSTASVIHPCTKPHLFSEKDWNEKSVRTVKEQGKDASPMEMYRASKTLAEKSAWEFVEKNKDGIRWDLVVLNPSYVFGPSIHEFSSPATLNTSNQLWYSNVLSHTVSDKSLESLAMNGATWLDVRDLGDAHVKVLQRQEAGGERVIISRGACVWQDWLDAANSLPASLKSALAPPHPRIAKGNPGSGVNAVHIIEYDTTKMGQVLGIKKEDLRCEADCAEAMIKVWVERGW